MILVDAGPLIALLDRRDALHSVSTAEARKLGPTPMLTTWPCFTEAMHILHKCGGYRFQAELWSLYNKGVLLIGEASMRDTARMESLMNTYRNVPMDLADASLVAAAESLGVRQIFTLDSDFRVYRLADGSSLDVVPH